MLVRAGFEVSEAEDGYQALAKMRNHPPDVVILDVMMPGIDGYTVCGLIRAEDGLRGIPVIMLSAKTDVQSYQRGLDAGAVKYLTKPISPEELTTHVREVLARIPEQNALVDDSGEIDDN
jgi:DNA-binding response OmpR family regulator